MSVSAPSSPVSRPLAPRPQGLPIARRGRISGLDGLRAVAVVGVIVFHAWPNFAPGGFAGVDVFFVLSGFLITSGLVRSGTVRLFWVRRARRLLPALALLLVVVGPLLHRVGGDAGVGFGTQLLSAVFFVTNWHLIAAGNSYFAQSAPPVLQHLWSLAVEEQFYLLWPLLLLGVVMRLRRRVSPVITVSALAAGSLAWAIMLANTGHIGRANYGSDSHSFGLLAGAALALWYAKHPPLPSAGVRLGLAGLTAMFALVVAFGVLNGDDTGTYAFGLPAVVGLTLILIDVVVRDAPLPLVNTRPLAWIGERSYGLYLWHWPLLVLMRNAWPEFASGHTVWAGLLAVAATVIAAAVSYRWVERPVQRLGFQGACWAAFAWAAGHGRAGRAVALGLSAALVVGVVQTVSAGTNSPSIGVEQSQIDAGIAAIKAADAASAAEPPILPLPRGAKAPVPIVPPVPTGRDIDAIGDSVMLASAPALLHRYPGIYIDAVVSRQASTAPGIIRALKKSGRLRPVVLIGLGTNGYLGQGTLAAIRQAAGPERELVFVNVFVPRPWAGSVNSALTSFVAHDKRALLVDWRDAISQHRNLLYPDGIHPDPSGGTLYAATVASTLGALRNLVPAVNGAGLAVIPGQVLTRVSSHRAHR